MIFSIIIQADSGGMAGIQPRMKGVAYSWGNAYYVDKQGDFISRHQLVAVLNNYLRQHPEASLLTLFEKNPLILTSKTKVRSLLSSLICDDIRATAWYKRCIKELIDCGLPGDENYFRSVYKLAGINTENFNDKSTGITRIISIIEGSRLIL